LRARRPTGRRFGTEADARWNGFHGSLTIADRLDLLVRDADAAVLNATKPTRVLTHHQAQDLVGRPVVSPDATPEDADAARRSAT
jgi:hypothetical protein